MTSGIVFIVVLTSLYFLLRNEGNKRLLLSAFVFRILCSLLFYYVYNDYYQGEGDAFHYLKACENIKLLFEENTVAGGVFYFNGNSSDVFFEWASHSRVFVFVQLIFPFYFLGGGGFIETMLLINTAIFVVIVFFIKTVSGTNKNVEISLFLVLLFLPSFVFWSSGLVKEGVSVVLLMLLYNHQRSLFNTFKWLNLFVVVFLFCILLELRYFLAFAFCIQVVIELLLRPMPYKKVVASFGAGVLFLITFLVPQLNLSRFPGLVLDQYLRFFESSTQQLIITTSMNGTWFSLLENMPNAFFEGLFRPFVWETETLFQLFSAIESLALFVLVGMTLFLLITKKVGLMVKPGLVFYFLTLALFLPLVAPSLGTLVRYRVLYVPVLWCFCVIHLLPFLSHLFYRSKIRNNRS